MKVKLLDYDKKAKEMLVFSKRTRHMSDEASWQTVLDMSQDELDKEIEYVFGTIGSSWEFVHYTFLITDVTRAFTHQMVRHRVGVAFAQQAQRVGTQEDFDYLLPPEIEKDPEASETYNDCMSVINVHYQKLLALGIRPQDARGVLPTNIYTNIMVKINLRALSDLLTVRLCLRAQGEFQNVAKLMRDEVLAVHPWVKPVLAVNCVRFGVCKFPRYTSCPVSNKLDYLKGIDSCEIEEEWMKHAGTDPQPEAGKDWKNG